MAKPNDAKQAREDYYGIVRPWLMSKGFTPAPTREVSPAIYKVGYGTYDNITITVTAADGRSPDEHVCNVLRGIETGTYDMFANVIQAFLPGHGTGPVTSCMVVPVYAVFAILEQEPLAWNVETKEHGQEGSYFKTIPFKQMKQFCREQRHTFWCYPGAVRRALPQWV